MLKVRVEVTADWWLVTKVILLLFLLRLDWRRGAASVVPRHAKSNRENETTNCGLGLSRLRCG